MNLKKVILYLSCLLLFLLPWQTRLMYRTATLNGGFWEYGSDSLYGTELLLGVIMILFLVDFLKDAEMRKKVFNKEYFQSRKKLLYYYIIILLFLALQVALSINPGISWGWGVRGIEAACLAMVIVLMNKLTFKLITAFWLGGVVQGALALAQFLSQEVVANKWLGMAYHAGKQLGDYAIEFGSGDMAERWLRAYGSFGSPNILGGFLAVCWLTGILLYSELQLREKYKAAILVSLGNVIVTVGLVLSFSRSAWLGAAAGAVMMVAVALRTRAQNIVPLQPTLKGNVGAEYFQPVRSIIRQLVFSILVVALLFVIYKPLFLVRSTAEGRLETKSLIERQTQYNEAMKIINKHALWGTGPGTYTLALYRNNPRHMVWEYQPVHNVWVLSAAEMGVVGIILLLLLHYYIITLLWKHERILISILIPVLVISFFDHYWWSLYSGMIFWGAVMGLALSNISEQKNQPE